MFRESVMSLPFILAVCGATLGGLFALLGLALARAPGGKELRWFALIAGTAGLYCACVAAELGSRDDAWGLALSRASFALAAINMFAWLRYSPGRPARGLDRALDALLVAIGALALVPGLLVGSAVAPHPGVWGAGIVPTVGGLAGAGLLFAVLAVPVARYVARWRAGQPGAGAHALGLAVLAAAIVVDALYSASIHAGLHLAALAMMGTVIIVGGSLARRFVDRASEREALTTRLGAMVGQRTAELAGAQEGLVRFEKFAVLGRLSAAVAHEINNPAAAVAANLGYMRDMLKNDGTVPPDAVDVIADTLESIQRIARIVQQLGEAGEVAIRGGAASSVSLAETVRRASSDAYEELGDVAMSLDVPEDLYVRTQEGSLRQVVTGLIISAARAARALDGSGRIRVEAERKDDRVVLRVVDWCPERDAAARARRFDPFVSARAAHVAQGVGLSVSVALLRVFGGNMRLERSDGEGNSVVIEIQPGETPAHRSEAPPSSRAPRARVLLVDDDVLVRIGLRRLLGREYVLDEAGSVEEALAIVRAHGDDLDAIVCDLVMPDGGARKVLEGLQRISPRLADAMVLMTGGAVDEPTQAMLEAHADRVLRKPIDVAAVRTLIERVRRHRSELGLKASGRT
jgi:signal transduction histidine kinase/ActR/RegA family two-component response regulator